MQEIVCNIILLLTVSALLSIIITPIVVGAIEDLRNSKK